MRNISNFRPLMQQLVITAMLLFVAAKREDFPRFPLNDQTRPLIEDMRYKTVMGNLLATVATRIGGRLKNDSRLIELCVCVHETKTVSDYARCLTPLLNKRRRKRSGENISLSERVVAVISYFLRLARQLLFREVTDSRKRLNEPSRTGSPANGESRYGKMFHQFWDSIDKAINERNLSKLLPDSPFPLWLEKRVRDVRELMDEMKQSDNTLPSLRILSPRLMAMNPIDGSVTRILSPDLISLYERGMTRSATLRGLIDEVSIWPKLIRNKIRKHSSTVSPLKDLKEMQKKMGELDESLSDAQLKRINDKGYAFLREDQLELLYDKHSLPVQPALYSRMNEQEKEEALEEYIVKLASESNQRERRQIQVGNAVLLKPFISMSTTRKLRIAGICLELTNFLKLPVTNRTRMVIDGLLYERAANALMSVVATTLLRQLDDTEKFNLYNCTQQSENNAKYATCLIPYLTTTGKTCPNELRRSKRSATSNLPSLTLEKTLRWLSQLVRLLKNNTGSSPADSTQTEKDSAKFFDERAMEELLSDSSSKAAEYFSDVKAAITSALNVPNEEELLPANMAVPEWFNELIKNVRLLIDDMKVIEDKQNIRILSPKIFSTKPDPENTLRILSPEVLHLHDRGVNDVKHFDPIDGTLSLQEKQALLELITEVSSGSNLNMQMKAIGDKSSQSATEPKYVTKLWSNETIGSLEALKTTKELFSKLDPSYSDEQLRTVRDKGYSFLRVDQDVIEFGDTLLAETIVKANLLTPRIPSCGSVNCVCIDLATISPVTFNMVPPELSEKQLHFHNGKLEQKN
ncbi:hypothetical protein D918_08236 [Trichuris suis]|nr:hypothetical protein D918_08236 [Trichuris suis]